MGEPKSMSDAQDAIDRRPRHVRAAEQNFLQGYTLYVNEEGSYAIWRHVTRSMLHCPIGTVTEIIGELGERFAEQITIRRPGAARAAKQSTSVRRVMSIAQSPAAPEDVETRAPDDEDTKGTASEETIPVVLDRRTYTSSELGASPPRRLLDDIADFIVDDDIPGSHDDQDAASEPDGVPEDSFVFVSSAENFVGRPTGDGYDELPEDEDADGPVLVPAKVSLLPVANAVDAMSRATKVLRCVLHALYFDVESADGDDTHDGMAFIVQGEVNNLLEAHEGLEKYLEARRG